MQYPAHIKPEDGGYVVTFRDIPEAITQGDTLEDALVMAADALLTAMDFYVGDRCAVPAPSVAKRGEHYVSLPASATAKVLLLNAMVEQNVRPFELAARLGTSQQMVGRLIDLHHVTKIDAINDALIALGKRLAITLVAA